MEKRLRRTERRHGANIGDALGALSGRVEKTLEQFKEFIEQRGRETGGWRGHVHDSRRTQ